MKLSPASGSVTSEVKVTSSGAVPVVGVAVMLTVGGVFPGVTSFTVIAKVSDPVSVPSDMVSVTVYGVSLAVTYSCIGFSSVEVFPSPKSQA